MLLRFLPFKPVSLFSRDGKSTTELLYRHAPNINKGGGGNNSGADKEGGGLRAPAPPLPANAQHPEDLVVLPDGGLEEEEEGAGRRSFPRLQ